MAGSQQILREYLISLGYSVDTGSEKKFQEGLLKNDKAAQFLLKTLVGVGVATTAMVDQFARSMDRLYYSSRRAETSAGNLQALSYGAKTIGLSGDQLTASLEGMARALRTSPGLTGLIESFGVSVTGRDRGKVMTEFIRELNKLPFYVGSQYASMFGIGPDEYLLLSEGLDKLEAAAEARKQMAADAGLDADEAARAGVEYTNLFRTVTEKLSILKDAIAIALLPSATKFLELISEGITKATIWMRSQDAKDQVKQVQGAPDKASSFLGKYWDYTKWFWGGRKGASPFGAGAGTGAAPSDMSAVSGDNESLFNMLETKYGLPMGMLDKIWLRESSRGKNMLSPAGAKGHFGFMPNTAKEYGIEGKENDLESSAEAAARKLRNLLNHYGGDDQLAAMGYNFGEGNMAKVMSGKIGLPDETRLYGEAISGRPVLIQQTTTITVDGAGDPHAAARGVLDGQATTNEQLANVVRNRAPKVQ